MDIIPSEFLSCLAATPELTSSGSSWRFHWIGLCLVVGTSGCLYMLSGTTLYKALFS